jgi:hypothetical protein
MNPLGSLFLALALCGLVGCGAQPGAPAPSGDTQGASVVRREMPEAAASAPTVPSSALGIVVPPDAQYVCVADANGARTVTTIELSSKVRELCRRHPEMGPCQYERNLCRRRGGRVFAAGGVEITMDTEAEYDRKVMRVRFKSN